MLMSVNSIKDMAGIKSITMAHSNIRSINRKLEEVVRILSQGDIEILCLSETWLNSYVPDHMISISGYDMIRHDRTEESGKRTGGGVMIYYKNYLAISQVSELSHCDPNSEIMWVKLSLKQTRPTYLSVTYRPPDGELACTTELLNDQITTIRSWGNCDIMTIGDMNVDLSRIWDGRSKKLHDFYKIVGLTNLIKGVTCHGNDSQSCIDHISVSRADMYQSRGIININASDHNLIYAVRKQPKVSKSDKFIWACSYRRFEATIFERDILFADWTGIIQEHDAGLAWSKFSERLVNIINMHAPFQKMRISESQPKWVTLEYIAACDARDHHFDVYSKNKTDAN